MNGYGIDRVSVDVSRLVRDRGPALRPHLVTRPTGRAIRLAIQNRLRSMRATPLSVIDFSEVRILDYSCADEVVARLLLRQNGDSGIGRPRPANEIRSDPPAFFVFSGVDDRHLEPIQTVLERHGLAAVAETGGVCRLVGRASTAEVRAWKALEARGVLARVHLAMELPHPADRAALDSLARRRLAFRTPASGNYLALSELMKDPVT